MKSRGAMSGLSGDQRGGIFGAANLMIWTSEAGRGDET